MHVCRYYNICYLISINIDVLPSMTCYLTDMVVGSPDDGDGKVFIFYGSSDGLKQVPSQV